MSVLTANNAFSTLAAPLGGSSLDVSITLQPGHGARFPVIGGNDWCWCTLSNVSAQLEVVKVTARYGDVLTVIRGQDSSVIRSYESGDAIELRPVAALFNDKAGVLELSAHIGDPSAAHAASTISVAPTGDITSTEAQAALVELDTKKASLTGATFTGTIAGIIANFTGALTVGGAFSALSATITNALSAVDGTFTGILKTKVITETQATVNIVTGAMTLDLAAASTFLVNMHANATIGFVNPPATGTPVGFMLILTMDGTLRTMTWPAEVKWPNAFTPVLSSGVGKKDVFSFFTNDGGATYLGFVAGQNI